MGRALRTAALRLLGASTLLSAITLATAEASDWRGVSPELQQKLAGATSFSCDKGALKLSLARLNDNYCDCEDGSDEPGTSACSHTRAVFHCANRGFLAVDVPTSRVNDGVCDCCDASDEYASGTACAVDCDERMTAFRAERAELIELMDAGAKDRVTLEAEARAMWDETHAEATQLEASTASLRVMLEQLQARKDEDERLEQEEKRKRVWGGKQELMHQLGLLELTVEQLASVILVMTREGLTEKHQVLGFIRKEREAGASGDAELHQTLMDEQDDEFVKRDTERQKETRRIEKKLEKRRKEQEKREQAARDAEEAAAQAEAGETTEAEASDAATAEVETPAPTEAAAEQSEEEEEDLTLPEVEARPIDLLFDALAASEEYESQEAGETRSKYEEAKKELKEEEKKLEKAKQVADKYYGPDNLLLALRDTCVESDPSAYTYKICFFGKATQDKIKLGDMEDLQAPGHATDEDVDAPEGQEAVPASGLELKWVKGAKCWNGPNRSLSVTLECGPLPMALYDVDEPQTCVYTAKLRTPVACDEAHRQRIMTLDSGAAPVEPHHIEIEVSPTL